MKKPSYKSALLGAGLAIYTAFAPVQADAWKISKEECAKLGKTPAYFEQMKKQRKLPIDQKKSYLIELESGETLEDIAKYVHNFSEMSFGVRLSPQEIKEVIFAYNQFHKTPQGRVRIPCADQEIMGFVKMYGDRIKEIADETEKIKRKAYTREEAYSTEKMINEWRKELMEILSSKSSLQEEKIKIQEERLREMEKKLDSFLKTTACEQKEIHIYGLGKGRHIPDRIKEEIDNSLFDADFEIYGITQGSYNTVLEKNAVYFDKKDNLKFVTSNDSDSLNRIEARRIIMNNPYRKYQIASTERLDEREIEKRLFVEGPMILKNENIIGIAVLSSEAFGVRVKKPIGNDCTYALELESFGVNYGGNGGGAGAGGAGGGCGGGGSGAGSR